MKNFYLPLPMAGSHAAARELYSKYFSLHTKEAKRHESERQKLAKEAAETDPGSNSDVTDRMAAHAMQASWHKSRSIANLDAARTHALMDRSTGESSHAGAPCVACLPSPDMESGYDFHVALNSSAMRCAMEAQAMMQEARNKASQMQGRDMEKEMEAADVLDMRRAHFLELSRAHSMMAESYAASRRAKAGSSRDEPEAPMRPTTDPNYSEPMPRE